MHRFPSHPRRLLALARLTVATLALTPLAPAAESLSVLLQKAIYAEETEGNLESAITLYEQIASDADTNRPFVAQAKYRLAVCYQKQGKKEQAIKLLDALIQQTPADIDLSRKARETLTQLGAPVPQRISVRKLSVPFETGWFMSVSADGHLVAYQPLNTQDIAVGELATGKSWTAVKGIDGKSPWNEAQISPDSQWIAYDLAGEIYVARIDGTAARKLHKYDPNKAGGWADGWAEIEGWSDDSGHLLVEFWPGPDSAATVVSFDVRTGARKEVTHLSKLPAGSHDIWSFSSNGRYIARRRGNYPRMITLVDLPSGREETVVDHDAESVIGWLPGDAKFLFSKDSGAHIDLMCVGVADGKLSGSAELVWSNWGKVYGLGVTRDGNIYYAFRNPPSSSNELWVMEGVLATKGGGKPPESWRSQTDIPTDEMILGSDNSLLDRKFGLAATMPDGWAIKSAIRMGNGVTVIDLNAPGAGTAILRMNYATLVPGAFSPDSGLDWINALGPRPSSADERRDWLRKFAQLRTEQQTKSLANYKNRDSTFSPRMIGGHAALSWWADFSVNGKPWVEYMTFVDSEKLSPGLSLRGPAEKVEALRVGFDRFIESLRIP